MEPAILQKIAWQQNIEEAQKEAESAGKMVLVELYSSQCFSCQNMETRTFMDDGVAGAIENGFVPVHFDVLHEPQHFKEFIAGWTPTFIAQCPDGNTHRRWVGFLPPKQFIGELALSKVLYALHRQSFDEMHKLAQRAVEITQDDETRHSEALYWQAVAAYKASDHQELLVAGWKDLLARFPNSEWAKRVDFANEL